MANVLIVEDDKDLNTAYSIILNNEGHNVQSAFDGQEALKKTETFTPQLILLDLLMPIMGGLEFLERFNLSNNKNVKVLIFTNMENSPEVAKAYELGAHRCIIKSWTAPHNLARVVREALESDPVKTKPKNKAKT